MEDSRIVQLYWDRDARAIPASAAPRQNGRIRFPFPGESAIGNYSP